MDTNEYIKIYEQGRDKAIVQCIKEDSVEPFKKFIADHEKTFSGFISLPSDEVLAISIRKMCLHCMGIEPEIKGMAVDWLLKNNHKLDL